MIQNSLSRRAFLRTTADTARGSCIVLSTPMILSACSRSKQAQRLEEDFRILTTEDAMEFEAIASRIMPSDETPGATEAGVIYFIDTILSKDLDSQRADLLTGLQELQASVVRNYGTDFFHQLDTTQQDELLTQIQTTEFFATIRYLSIAGMFSLPEYGGNKDRMGFQLLGLEEHQAWQAPYGFYDADYAEKGE